MMTILIYFNFGCGYGGHPPKKKWRVHQRLKSKRMNPVSLGFQFIEYLRDHPNATYGDLSNKAGVTKARICQIIALFRKLPSEITDFMLNTDEPEILKYFTERRLRPLTLLATDDDKIRKFAEMKETINSFS